MPHYVKVAVGQENVVLPNGKKATAGDIVLLTDAQYAKIPAANLDGVPLIYLGEDIQGANVISIPITLANMPAGAGDVVTDFPLQGNGKITQIAFVTTTVSTGAGATRAINLEIGTTNLTGGVLTLTLAGTDTVGETTVATAITGTNSFVDGDLLSVEVAAGTVFTGGAGVLLITVE